MPGRRTVVAVVGALVAVALVVGAVLWIGRGDAPEDAAEEYLAATWHGDWEVECELATEQWRHVLYAGHPFADCAAYAEAATKARGDREFAAFEPETDVVVSTELISEDDDRARVEYVVELRYHGADRKGFEELWQEGGAVDRGTVELTRVDGSWRVAGVDSG